MCKDYIIVFASRDSPETVSGKSNTNNQTSVAHKGWPCQWVPAPLGTIVQEEQHTPDQQMEKQAASAHQEHTVVSLRLQALTLLSGNCQQSS